MKKVLVVLLFVFTFTLTGCDQVEETVTDLQTKLTEVTSDLSDATATITSLETTLTTANTSITELETSLEDAESEIAALQSEIDLTNTKIKNALSRDTWTKRKVTYNPDYSTNNEEYCFGIFNDDWSTLPADDYKHNGGLKFVITIEQMSTGWSTEIFAKDSCGNYSNFLFENSMYAFYSAPDGYFEVGETYEVVLYKESYFPGSPEQLGFLPAADLVQGAYPEDLSALVINKQEQ